MYSQPAQNICQSNTAVTAIVGTVGKWTTKTALCEKNYNFGSVGLWAGWEYIGLRYIYQSNTVVTAIAWHSGLVDDQNCSM